MGGKLEGAEVGGQKSEVRGQESEVRNAHRKQTPTSDFRLLTSDFRLLTSDFRLLTSDFRLLTSDFRLLTPPRQCVIAQKMMLIPSGNARFSENSWKNQSFSPSRSQPSPLSVLCVAMIMMRPLSSSSARTCISVQSS